MTNIYNILKLATALSGQPDIDTLTQKQIEINDSVKTEIIQPVQKETFKFSTENIATTNSKTDVTEVKLSRISLDAGNTTIKYDYKPNNGKSDPKDMGMIMQRNIFDVEGLNARLFKQGNWDKNDVFYLQGIKNINLEDGKLLFHAGYGLGQKIAPQTFIGGMFQTKDTYLESVLFSDKPLFNDTRKSFYIAAAKEIIDNLFVGYGRNDGKDMIHINGIDMNDFGQITVLDYDFRNDNWSFKSQSVTGKINKNLFNFNGSAEILSNFAIEPFFPLNLSNAVSKTSDGYALKLQGKGNATKTELEVLLGTNISGYGFGAGYTWNNSGQNGATFEVYKKYAIGENGSIAIDGIMNTMTKETKLLLKAQYDF